MVTLFLTIVHFSLPECDLPLERYLNDFEGIE